MRAKRYNKKKALSLVLMPMLACSVATQAVNATVSVPAGDSVTITGTNNTEPYAGAGPGVSVILDANAQLDVANDTSYSYTSAIYLLSDSTVTLNAGSQVSLTGTGPYSAAIDVVNTYNSAITDLNLDGGSIVAEAIYYGVGISVYDDNTDGNLTTIDLINGSSINAEADINAAGIWLNSYDNGSPGYTSPSHYITIDDASTISANASSGSTYYSETWAVGILAEGLADEGTKSIVLDNNSTLDAHAEDAGNTPYSFAYGIISDGADLADVRVDNGSSIDVSAMANGDAEAWAFATGVEIDALNSSVVLNSATLGVAADGYADLAQVNAGAMGVALYGQYATAAVSDSLLTISADAESAGGYAESSARGIEINASNPYGGKYDPNLLLESSTLSLDATAVAYNSAMVEGIGAMVEGASSFAEVNDSMVSVTLNSASLDGSAMALGAGIGAFSYGTDATAGVLASGSSISLDVAVDGASGYSGADLYGVFARSDGGSTLVELENSDLTLHAAVANEQGAAMVNATGVTALAPTYAEGKYSGLALSSLYNSTVTLDAEAIGADAAFAEGVGVLVEGAAASVFYGMNTDINVTVSASSSGTSAYAPMTGAVQPQQMIMGDAVAEATGIESLAYYESYVMLGNALVNVDAAVTGSGYAEGYAAAAGVLMDGEYLADFEGASLTLDVGATVDTEDGRADANAEGISQYAWSGSTSVDLQDSTVNVAAQAGSTGSYADAYALGIDSSTSWGSGQYSSVSLYNSTVNVDSYVDAYASAWTAVEGATVNGHQGTSVILNSATLEATAGANVQGYGSNAWVNAMGISADSRYGDVAISFLDSNLQISASASSNNYGNAETWALGLDAWTGWDSSGGVDITLENSNVNLDLSTTANNDTGWSEARGINISSGGDVSVTLNSATLGAAAATEVMGDYGRSYAEGMGIRARSNYGTTSVSLVNADLQATATASGSLYDGAEGNATGIEAWTGWRNTEDVSIDLTGSSLTASSSADGTSYTEGYAYGIEARSYGDAFVNLDSSSLAVAIAASSSEAHARALAEGINIDSRSGYYISYHTSQLSINNSLVDIEGSATAGTYARSEVRGLDVSSEDQATIALDSVTLNGTSSAQSTYGEGMAGLEMAQAYSNNSYNSLADITMADSVLSGLVDVSSMYNSAVGFGTAALADAGFSGSGSANINLDTTAVDFSVTASGDMLAGSYAEGLSADSKYGDASISLLDSSLNLSTAATASGPDSGAESWAVGMNASTFQYGSGISLVALNNAASHVQATAEAGAYADAMAYGVRSRGAGGATVTLDSTVLTTSADASTTGTNPYGAYGYAFGINVRGDSSVNLMDSTLLTASYAVSDADNGYAAVGAAGLYVTTNYNTAITLDNTTVTTVADAQAGSEFGGAAGVAVNPNVSDYFSGGTATIDLIGSSITTMADGVEDGLEYGIIVNNMIDTTINVDETSTISADWAVASNGGNVLLNNDGLIDGRVMVQDLNNSGTGVLHAAVSTESEVLNGGVNDDDSSYFTATDSAMLADGSTLSLFLEDDLGFTAPGQTRELYMVEAGSGTSNWTANDGAFVSILQDGFDSPILNLTYSDSSDASHFIVDATLLTRAESGISGNAQNAVNAALADGMLDWYSDPEEWVPDVSGASIAGTKLLIKSNVYNIEGRIGLLSGMNSGDGQSEQGLWLNLLYTDAEKDREDGVEGYEADTSGVIVGYDSRVTPEMAVGAAFTYAVTDAETDVSSEDYDLDEYMLSLYGDYRRGPWFGNAQLSYGWGDVDGERFAGGNRLTASYDTDVIYARLQAGKHMFVSQSNWVFSPLAVIDYAKISLDKYTEQGDAFALVVDPDDYNSMNIGAGVKVQHQGAYLQPELRAVAYYDVIGDEIETRSSFVGGTTSFKTEGAEADRFSWDLGAALKFGSDDSPLSFRIGYDLVGSEDYTSHNFNGKLRYEF